MKDGACCDESDKTVEDILEGSLAKFDEDPPSDAEPISTVV